MYKHQCVEVSPGASLDGISEITFAPLVTARIRRIRKVMFSVCPHLGGRGSGSKVNPAGGSGQRSIQLGVGIRVKGQSSWGVSGRVRVKGQSSRGVRSKVNPAGGVRSKDNPAGGVRSKVNPAGGGQVQPGGSGPPVGGGVRSSRGGSASCALLRAVCLLRSRRRTFWLSLILMCF